MAVDIQLHRAGNIQLHQSIALLIAGDTAVGVMAVWSRSAFAFDFDNFYIQLSWLIYRPGRNDCVVQTCVRFVFSWLLIYSYAALMIYSCAGYALALLIAVYLPHWSTRLCRPESLSL